VAGLLADVVEADHEVFFGGFLRCSVIGHTAPKGKPGGVRISARAGANRRRDERSSVRRSGLACVYDACGNREVERCVRRLVYDEGHGRPA